MKCESCGSENREGAKFCASCGTQLSAKQEQTTQNSVQNEGQAAPQQNVGQPQDTAANPFGAPQSQQNPYQNQHSGQNPYQNQYGGQNSYTGQNQSGQMPPPYGRDMYGNPIHLPVSKGPSIAAMVCGIICVLTCSVFYINIPLAIIAIVLGATSIKKLKSENQPCGMAIAGVILGTVGLAIMALFYLFVLLEIITYTVY